MSQRARRHRRPQGHPQRGRRRGARAARRSRTHPQQSRGGPQAGSGSRCCRHPVGGRVRSRADRVCPAPPVQRSWSGVPGHRSLDDSGARRRPGVVGTGRRQAGRAGGLPAGGLHIRGGPSSAGVAHFPAACPTRVRRVATFRKSFLTLVSDRFETSLAAAASARIGDCRERPAIGARESERSPRLLTSRRASTHTPPPRRTG